MKKGPVACPRHQNVCGDATGPFFMPQHHRFTDGRLPGARSRGEVAQGVHGWSTVDHELRQLAKGAPLELARPAVHGERT